MLRAVIFDVDFTLARPGPELGPEGYRKVGERHGLTLDPGLYESARLAALESLQRHPDHVHDDELWIAFTERIVHGMGGDGDGARACADELVRAWEQHERFTLYEDALPALAELREHGDQDRPDLERQPRPGRVRRPPRPRRRLRRRLTRVRPHEAAPGDLPPRAGAARRPARGGGDDRRLLRGRHRGRPCARDEGVPARPRRPAGSTSPTVCPTSSRCRPPSA